MHDSVAHDLFALVYGIDELLGEAKLSENGREKLLSLQSRARSAMKEVRQAIYQMSTLKSGKEPFVEEVGEYLESLGTLNDVAVDFDHDDRLHDMKAATRHALYRIIREATGNAVRHGQCDSINVALGVEENTISLRVEDDGTGFDPTAFDYRSDEERESGLGLINMKEQARALGGNLEIESSTGEGTTVTCVLPRTDNGRVRREASND
jgi:signal transduction histidine kinase